jgi:hypothetical protein
MNASELAKIGQELYGKKGWLSEMAASLSVDVSTIRRWMYNNHVPGPAAAALQCFKEAKKRG